MSTVALVTALLLPADIPPDPEPVDLSSGDWVLPVIIAATVLAALAVTVAVIVRRRRLR